MIDSLLKIRGIGLLHDAVPKAVKLAKLNIFYGENGRGKTTFTSILRSLILGTPTDIEQRKTINGKNHPEVELLVEGALRKYISGTWNVSGANILIFDSTFVEQNVYSGAQVDADHRRNLYSFAVGEEGVKLAKEVDSLAQQITAATSDVNKASEAVGAKMAVRNISVEEFLTLDPLENAESEIERQQKYVLALQDSKSVSDLLIPAPLLSPTNITRKVIEDLLRKSLDGISRETELLVRKHIEHSAPSEDWISSGLAGMHDQCPFCGRDTRVPLIEAYKIYFGEAYKNHKTEIVAAITAVRNSLSTEAGTIIANRVLSNATLLEKWSRFIPLTQPNIDTKEISANFSSLLSQLNTLLEQKQLAPLEIIELGADADSYFRDFEQRLKEISAYNTKVTELGTTLNAYKKELESGDLLAAQTELNEALNRRVRHMPEVQKLCTAYKKAKNAKELLVKQKDKAKEALDLHSDKLLSLYQTTINEYIEHCGGNFKIAGMKTAYPGGLPRVEYAIKVFGESIDLTNKKPNAIGFKTSMSQGDKNTLAFAFFLARLKHSADLSKTTVVFDDPLSSLDCNRRQFTRNHVLAVAETCNQLLILTHDDETAAKFGQEASRKKFLKDPDRTYWEFRPVGDYTEIHPLDLTTLARLPYMRNWELLEKFTKIGAAPDEYHSIVRAIRPCLEDNLKFRFPDEIKNDKNLGQIIKLIRESTNSDQIHGLLGSLTLLEQLDAYTTKHSHGDETGSTSEKISGVELKTHAQLCIGFMRGLPGTKAAGKS